MKKLFAAALMLLMSQFALAATYTYTGSTYDNGIILPYTNAMRITGSFTTAAPLSANLVDSDISALVTSYSFNDGINTYTNTDPNGRVYRFIVSTNASGGLSNTDIALDQWQGGSAPHAYPDTLNTIGIIGTGSDAGIGVVCGAVNGADVCVLFAEEGEPSGATATQPGTWVATGLPVAAAIPALSPASLLALIALIALALYATPAGRAYLTRQR